MATPFLCSFLDCSLDAWLEGNDGTPCPPAAAPRLVALAQSAVRDIPAYAAVQSSGPATYEEYSSTWPFLGKAEFVNRFPMAQRCRGGDQSALETLHASSGSSGVPTFWGRTTDDEVMTAARFEQVLRDNFQAHEKRTLAVIAFPLGSWVGGVFTYNCLRYLSHKGYKVTQVTPGNNMDEILKVIQALSPAYEQTIVLGYPPFVKGVVDKGVGLKVPWASYHMGFVFAGEVFSEEFRSLVAQRSGISAPAAPYRIVSIYGTADAGVLAVETPLSATIRRWLSEQPEVMRELFQGARVPSLFQYDPLHRYFEHNPDDGTLALTTMPALARRPHAGGGGGGASNTGAADGGIAAAGSVVADAHAHSRMNTSSQASAPAADQGKGAPGSCEGHDKELDAACRRLVMPSLRYAIGDIGGLKSFDDLLAFLTARGYDIKAPGALPPHRRLPFVWVLGRAHWTVSLYGANVYVENVMPGLEKSEVAALVTGKFILAVNPDPDDCRLLLRVELSPSVSNSRPPDDSCADILAIVTSSILTELLRLNSEYQHYVPQDKQEPRVLLYRFGDIQYFPQGVKHKYI